MWLRKESIKDLSGRSDGIDSAPVCSLGVMSVSCCSSPFELLLDATP